jgi:ParB family chromosome partitioning protein
MVDRRLGRGLDFFLSGGKPASGQSSPQSPPSSVPTRESDLRPPGEEVAQVEVSSLVVNPFQPRKEIHEGELRELAESIRTSGVLQPILARRVGEKLEIIAGERRWRAAQLAGLSKVPVMVRNASDQDSAVFALVENLQREDLNAMEKAQGFKLLLTTLNTTQEGVAKKVGLDRTTVTNFLRLLDLPAEVQAHVSRGTLSMGHARCLLALGDTSTITQIADETIKHAWSVRSLEAKVKEALEASKGEPARAQGSAKARPVWLNELEETLVEALGTTVQIRYGRKRSQIVIDCAGREEFERVFQRLKNA